MLNNSIAIMMYTSSVFCYNHPTHTSRSRVCAAEHDPEHTAHAVARHRSRTRERDVCAEHVPWQVIDHVPRDVPCS